MKKFISVLLAVTMFIMFVSCKNNNKTENKTEPTKQSTSIHNETSTFSETSTEILSESIKETGKETETENETESISITSEIKTETITTKAETTSENSEPSEWSAEEIVEFYKASATRSNKVTSVQKMTLEELTVNDGDGTLGKLVEFITPFFVNALEKNSTEFVGITGGYENLTVSDIENIKAYKDGNCTVVEMTLKEQTDGVHADNKSGTVGHAISVVGDVSVVEEELPQFKIDFDNANVSLKYSNPKVKVRINEKGIIESGVWSYTVCINIENLRIDAKKVPVGATVDKGYGEVGYIITVN